MIEEILFQFVSPTLENPAVQAFGVALLRSVFGWLRASIKDSKIDKYEWKELADTFFRMLPQSLGLSVLFGPAGAVGSLFTDKALETLKPESKKK